MTQAISARRDGDAFQARIFWLKAAYLLDDDSPVSRVGFEHGPRGFDDLWVEYEPGRLKQDQYGQPLAIERFQCKWHVGPGQYTHIDLTKPEYINATSTSFLQRAYGAYVARQSSGTGVRFKLVTNHRVDPNDPLHGLIRSRSHTLKVDDLFAGKTDRSAAGQVRKLWREHLQIDDTTLRGLAQTLGFWDLQDSLEQLREQLDMACKAFGLKRVSASSSSTIYDDIIYQWASQGRLVFDRKTFRQACAQDGLLERERSRSIVFGIKSFEHAFDSLEDRCVKVLDLVSEFDERFIRDTAAWRNSLLPKLRQFLAEAAKTGERLRIAMDAHTTLAFAAGTVLDTKSGRVVEIEQRTPTRVLWSPDDSPTSADWAGWDVASFNVDSGGRDIAVAIGITHDVEPKVRVFLDARLHAIRSLLVCRPTTGPSQQAVVCGAHALQLAESLAARVKGERERMGGEQDRRVHLFIAGPNGFSFYLGRHVQSLKPLTLYEFDFEGRRGGSYAASLSFPEIEPGDTPA